LQDFFKSLMKSVCNHWFSATTLVNNTSLEKTESNAATNQKRQQTAKIKWLTTLSTNHTSLPQRIAQQLKVRFLEQALGGAIWIARVGNNDIKLILVRLEELEPIAHVHGSIACAEPGGHARQVLLGQADDGLVNVAEHGGLDGAVLDDFAQDAAVAAADDEHVFWVGVGVHGEVGDHFLVAVGFGLWLDNGHRELVGKKLTRTHHVRCIG
jgi:hypothetical protein